MGGVHLGIVKMGLELMFGILEASMLGTFLIMKGMVMEEKFFLVVKYGMEIGLMEYL